jgi:hypothetical protein
MPPKLHKVEPITKLTMISSSTLHS